MCLSACCLPVTCLLGFLFTCTSSAIWISRFVQDSRWAHRITAAFFQGLRPHSGQNQCWPICIRGFRLLRHRDYRQPFGLKTSTIWESAIGNFRQGNLETFPFMISIQSRWRPSLLFANISWLRIWTCHNYAPRVICALLFFQEWLSIPLFLLNWRTQGDNFLLAVSET